MGGESGRMFPFTLQTPTRHPCLYSSASKKKNARTCKTPSLTSAHTPSPPAEVNKHFQTWEASPPNESSAESERDSSAARRLERRRRRRNGTLKPGERRQRASPLIFWWCGVASVRGSKWDDAGAPFVRGGKLSCRTLPGDRKSLAAFGVDQRNPSCRIVSDAREQKYRAFSYINIYIISSTCWLSVEDLIRKSIKV